MSRNVISVSDISAVNLMMMMVVICLFDELRDSVFVYIPDRNNILRHTPATAFLPEAALLDRYMQTSPPSKPLQFFLSLNFFSCPAFWKQSEKFKSNELWSRVQLLSREMLVDTSSLVGRPDMLLAVGIGSIQSVDIWRSKGVKCL